MSTVVECVANFSEGRRLDVVDQIVSAIASIDGTSVLGYESDRDHNRSVVTFVGDRTAVINSAFEGIATASQLIDMDMHSGQHPRIGATDVIPFIPLENMTMQDCAKMAHDLGKRVGDELNIPVYLYGEAATRADRVNLADIRRGGYEGLKDVIAIDEKHAPDYGASQIGKAGATAIGARGFLVAYNMYLNTDNVDIARKIAQAVRGSSGGLRYVKALGLLVDGKAQVSMNLTDFTQTPVYHAVEMVRREAQRYGVMVERSELIGLLPQSVLLDVAKWYLQLDNLTPERVLEWQMSKLFTPSVEN